MAVLPLIVKLSLILLYLHFNSSFILTQGSASQSFVSTDGVFNARARALGGGTCINAGFYSRASQRYIKKVGWDSILVNESYPWIEKQIVHKPILAPWQKAVSEGLLEVGISPFNGYTYDHIYGTKFGGTTFDRYGRRKTAAVLLTSANPENLHVFVHATVQKIEFDTSGKKPRAVGVLFKDEKWNQTRHFFQREGELGQLSAIPPKQRTLEAIEAYKRNKKDIATPLSTGHLSLTSTEIDDSPLVTFNYFSHPHDLKRCVDGIRIVEKIVKSKHFTNYTQCDKETLDKLLNLSVQANINLIPKHTNNTESLEQFCKETVITIWHYHGGCQVGKVVSPDYRVINVNRLRVIDGSTFTESPGTNPQATVMMMGRYMGVKILRERLERAAGL
ncbi:unnamed protein product [Withania somnifera]